MIDTPWVVMRSHDDRDVIVQTLDALAAQDLPHRLLVFDNASVDGTADIVRASADRVVTVPRGQYVPGRVLNQAMELTTGPVVVFLNSDCTPVGASWLRRLLEPFDDPAVSAVFGQQEPRPGCPPLEAKDIREMYGDGHRQARFRHCFSMASSAIRRTAWEEVRFDESLDYSEDIDWSWRVRRRGGEIRYAPEARVLHSHAYTLRQQYRRQSGEGRAEARIFDWSPWSASLVRYSVLPYARLVLSDWLACAREHALGAAVAAPLVRLIQVLGRRAGFCAGLRKEVRS